METNSNVLNDELVVDAEAHQHLMETVKWAKFLGIVGFVICAIIVLAALFAGSFLANMTSNPAFPSEAGAGAGIMISIVYLVIAGVYFALSLFVYRFAVKTKQALLATDQVGFNQGLHNLKLVYRISGIIVVLYLALVAIAALVGIAAAAFS